MVEPSFWQLEMTRIFDCGTSPICAETCLDRRCGFGDRATSQCIRPDCPIPILEICGSDKRYSVVEIRLALRDPRTAANIPESECRDHGRETVGSDGGPPASHVSAICSEEEPPASHVSAICYTRIGLTPEVGERALRPNHALTCMVTAPSCDLADAISPQRRGGLRPVGVRAGRVRGDDVAVTTVVRPLVRTGNFQPRT